MNKIIAHKIGDIIYHEVLENGLEIYVYKKEGFNLKSASLTTKYGSCNNEFKYDGEKEYRTYPKGIAHFLEHKLFESEDNEQVFKKFENYGATVNAYTSNYETCYYFSTNENFDNCLNLLMDFVWSPYITDENVEKEKNIIKQEISMIDDRLSRFIYSKSMENVLVINNNRYSVAGTYESVDSITREELYECYNAFYHPSNMILTIAGDIDVTKTINKIKSNTNLNKFKESKKIYKKVYKEPKEVFKSYVYLDRNVSFPRMVINYKFIYPTLSGIDGLKRSYFFGQILDNNFSDVTTFKKELIKDKIIKTYFDFSYSVFEDVALLSFEADIIDKDKFLEKVEERLHNPLQDEKIFNLNKKSYLASIVRAYDDPETIINVIKRDIIKYGFFISDVYEIIEKYSFDEYKKEYEKLDFKNKSILYIDNTRK